MPIKVKKTTTKKPAKKKPTAKSTVTKKPAKKKPAVKKVAVEAEAPVVKKKDDYTYAVGRRKRSIARVRIYKTGDGSFIVNSKDSKEYFPHDVFQKILREPLVTLGIESFGSITVKVVGGGLRGQAESIRLGLSRALLKLDENIRPQLKARKLLTVDSRVKERKKYGLKKARKAPQWAKR